jgi:magnesium chelatase accessory protein
VSVLRERYVSSGSLTWYVQEAGAGPGLLLVHGTGASSDSFRALIPLLAHRFRVLAVDLPGHARTRALREFTLDLPHIAAALGELLATLSFEPQLVIGHSAGAAILIRMALDGLISPALVVGLAAALVPFEGPANVVFPAAARALASSRLAPLLIAMASTDENVERMVGSTGSRLDRVSLVHYQRLAQQPEHVAGVLSMLSRWDLAALPKQLERLQPPLLLIAGQKDKAVPAEQLHTLARRLPNARYRVLPHAGHLLHEEQPVEVAALVTKELDGLS